MAGRGKGRARRSGSRTKRPPVKFRLRLNDVQIVTGSELFERRVKGIKEGRKRALRRLGKLGKRIPQTFKPKGERVTLKALPKGTLKRRKAIKKIKVLVTARIKGRLGYFTKTLKLGEGKTGEQAKKIAKKFARRIEVGIVGRGYELKVLKSDISFESETFRAGGF